MELLMKTRVLGLLAATALTTAGISAASAADLPIRSAPPAPIIAAAPVFTWTGFYVGVNAGYGWGDDDTNETFLPLGTLNGLGLGAGGTGGILRTENNDDREGFLGGAQVGYNFQVGSFVWGVEADIQAADLGDDDDDGSVSYTVTERVTGGAALGTVLPLSTGAATFFPASRNNTVDWFGTLRARAGVAFDRALIYATGGLAFGGADDDNRFGIGSDDDINWGWTVGAGVEYAFTNNLTLKIEGLYVNLDGDDNNDYVGTAVSAGGVETDIFVPGAGNNNDNDFFIARAGLNFKFGSY